MPHTNQASPHPCLPTPDQKSWQHSLNMQSLLHSAIKQQEGFLSFDQYMDLVLFEPQHGYYCKRYPFGEQGDFTTAAESSPLFARCLANQCRPILDSLPGSVMLELGAGSGYMAAQILWQLEQYDALPEAYLIVEISNILQQQQRRTIQTQIPHLYERVHWSSTLPEETICGVVVANEFIDALPVHRFVLQHGDILEQGVGLSNSGQLEWRQQVADTRLTAAVQACTAPLAHPLPPSYCSEINLQLIPWLTALDKCLQRGVMLFIDYGYPNREYYHPQRQDGTLCCHYRHHMHGDPLIYPGIQDITAAVNFTALAEAASMLTLEVKGYTTQGYFLIDNGLGQEMQRFDLDDHQIGVTIARQARLLTLAGEMGEYCKVMALGKNFDQALQGFSTHDQRLAL